MIDLETAIRSAIADIVAASPEPERIHSAPSPARSHDRHAGLFAFAAVTVAVAVGAVVVIARDDEGTTLTNTAEPTASTAPTPTTSTPNTEEAGNNTVHGYPAVDAVATVNSDGEIELDHGADDGIMNGMMVIDTGGVVGKIIQVFDTSSVLLLVDDPEYVIECVVVAPPDGDRQTAGCEGTRDGTMMIRQVAELGGRVADPGAQIETAGGPYSLSPPGFALGIVAANSTTGVIDIAANLETLHDVQVIKYRPTAAAQPEFEPVPDHVPFDSAAGVATTVTTTSPTTPDGAPVVAPSAPLIIVSSPMWKMESIRDSGPTGEATSTDGTLRLDLFWSSLDDRAGWADETENSSLSRATTTIDGGVADVLYRSGYTTAIWTDQKYTLRVRMDGVDDTTFASTIALLASVPEGDWIAALPPNVIRPAERASSIRTILSDVQLPASIDADSLASTSVVGSYDQLGFAVTKAAVCGWIEIWLDANDSGDTSTSHTAAAALAGSHNWTFLTESPAGAEILWNFADATDGKPISGGNQPEQLTRESATGLCSSVDGA